MGPQFMHFTHITGNVKEQYEVPLGQLTCITGDEASYKTAIGDGVLLALTGQHPIGKNPSDLVLLAADPLVGIQVTLQGESGTAHWRLNINPETGKAMRPNPPVFEGALASLSDDERYCIVPTIAVRELLKSAKGEKKVRESVLRRFGGDLKSMPEPFALRPEQEERWLEAVEEAKKDLGDDATADMILAGLSERFRGESSSLSRQITPLTARISAQKVEVQASLVGAERLPQLEAQLKLAIAWEDSTSAREALKGAQEKLKEGEAGLKKLQETEHEAQETAAAKRLGMEGVVETARLKKEQSWGLWIETARKLASAEANVSVYRKLVEASETGCPYCASQVGTTSLEATLKTFEQRAATRLESAKKLEERAKAAALEHEDAQHGLQGLLIADAQRLAGLAVSIQQSKNAIETTKATIRSLEEQLKTTPASYKGQTANELRSEIVVIQEARQNKADLLQEVAHLQEMEDERDLLKTLEKEAIELQRRVMLQVSQVASEEVSRCMTDGRRAVLDPVSCAWSVIGRDGLPHAFGGAACGTEETALMLGFAAAWTRGAPLRVAIFDDKDLIGLNKKGMADFFSSCEKAVERGDFTQVIIIFNRPEEVPSNWHKVLRTAATMTPPSWASA